MKNERQIAELIFDKFRSAKCKMGEFVMLNTIRSSLINTLNPKEKDLFNTVLDGLKITGYITYEQSIYGIRLTQKGFDYIYDKDQIEKMVNVPWIIPAFKNTDWEKAYNKMWRIIGPKDTAICYIKGPDFYDLVLKFTDELPPSYGKYVDFLRDKELSTSRVDYYKELINSLDEPKRFQLYGELQVFIENKLVPHKEKLDASEEDSLLDIVTSGIDTPNDSPADASILSDGDHPVVFISYSWDDTNHESWVLKLATRLREKYSIDVILDKWDMKLGKLLPHFMEHAITDSQRVICVMTPNYKKKTDNLSGGVGVEYSIISSEIQKNVQTDKYIPLLRAGSKDDIPTFLEGRNYVDMRDDTLFDENVKNIARDIWDEPIYKKPSLGSKPQFD